jgi:hypothetical protein
MNLLKKIIEKIGDSEKIIQLKTYKENKIRLCLKLAPTLERFYHRSSYNSGIWSRKLYWWCPWTWSVVWKTTGL